MYFLFFALLLLFLLCCLFHFRKKRIVCKIKGMCQCDKCRLLDDLAHPFGYRYHCRHGFFSSTLDAWQKKAGYTYLYDSLSPRFGMVLDTLPVYFDYNGKTWLIEFWKGQYGINTGAEIGIYHADRIIPEQDYDTALFEGAGEEELLHATLLLYNQNGEHLRTTQTHWWITAFLPGYFSNPSDLCLKATLHFPDYEMLSAFIMGLRRTDFPADSVFIQGPALTLTFCKPLPRKMDMRTRFFCRYSQWKNQLFCRLYLFVTKPFCRTEDRILYMYYTLPFAFRNILKMHRFHKRCHRRRRVVRKPS